VADHLTVGDLYEHTAAAYARGAEPVYRPMADALVAASPVDLAGERVLDVGAGTGAGSQALTAVGARPIAIDLAWTMLAHERAARPPAAVADLYHLPLRSNGLDAVLAPFVLNHVDQPVDALAELAGCVRPGGVVLASTFSVRDRPPVKAQIDAVVVRHGGQLPDAYLWMRDALAPLIGTADAMADAARRAGLRTVDAIETVVDTGVSEPADLVAYRFAMPQAARFLDSLPPAERADIVAEAVADVDAVHDGSPLCPTVIFLTAVVA
jgi:ubiquinone/menaquinone biosynthesis C-methylase UbiE